MRASTQMGAGEQPILGSMGSTFARNRAGAAAVCALALWTAACHGPAPAPARVWEKVMFHANVEFDSDRSALLAAGRETLDAFVAKIHGLDSQRITVIGYGDRRSHGSHQTLSRQRVDAVKAYLVGKGIASDRMQTSARGDTQPDTFAGKCKVANNAANVACTQADRHVFIEVSGTRIAK